MEHLLLEIIGHLGAAKMQRLPTDDRIIAEHMDAALELARAARKLEQTICLALFRPKAGHAPAQPGMLAPARQSRPPS